MIGFECPTNEGLGLREERDLLFSAIKKTAVDARGNIIDQVLHFSEDVVFGVTHSVEGSELLIGANRLLTKAPNLPPISLRFNYPNKLVHGQLQTSHL